MVGTFEKGGSGSSQKLPPQKITLSNWGAAAAPAIVPADRDGVSRIFSKELFERDIGDALRSVGFSPDMPANIAQTAESFAELDARSKQKLALFVERINHRLPAGLSVKPLVVVPESIWRGEYRNFLCATCRFYPADPTNVFFLAATQETAEKTGLPLRPNLAPAEVHDYAHQFVQLLGKIYEKELASGKTTEEAGRMAVDQARSLGAMTLVKIFDRSQFNPELELFGTFLRRDFDKIPTRLKLLRRLFAKITGRLL